MHRIAVSSRLLTTRLHCYSALSVSGKQCLSTLTPFKLADIGEGIAEVELMKWFVKKGDKVKAFDRLCEVQSDKATVEITSRYDGEIANLHYEEGNIVKVGSNLLDMIQSGASAVASPTPAAPAKKEAPKAPASSSSSSSSSGGVVTPFKLADIGEGIAEVELMKWFVKKGDTVKAFDRLCEVQSDKATVEITSRYDGVIAELHHEVGGIVKVGSSLLDMIQTGAAAAAPTAAAPAASAAAHPHSSPSSSSSASHHSFNNNKVQTTPAVRKIAKENNVDLSQVTPTGPKGRITKEDVQLYLKGGRQQQQQSRPAAAQAASAAATHSHTASPTSAQDTVVPIRGMQRLMVKSMTAANQVPHLTLCEEVIFDNLKALRAQLKKTAEKRGIKLSYLPFILKATSLALSQYPSLNATVNADVTAVTYHAAHNIGVAMDTPKGLIVPVIKNVQSKSILEIAQDLAVLQKAATSGTITEAQLQGGTFSLSNIGSIGGTYAVPVLVVPQVVIGALGRVQVLPRYTSQDGLEMPAGDIDSEELPKPTSILNVSWSADHRVVDGATVARFSNAWKGYLENPSSMIVEMK